MPATHQAIALTRLAAEAATSKKGGYRGSVDWPEQRGITDVFLIVTAPNGHPVGAAAPADQGCLLRPPPTPERTHAGPDDARWRPHDGQAGQRRYGGHPQAGIDAGVFGAPSYCLDGELFWGQDRLDFVERKLNPN